MEVKQYEQRFREGRTYEDDVRDFTLRMEDYFDKNSIPYTQDNEDKYIKLRAIGYRAEEMVKYFTIQRVEDEK